MRAIQRFVVMAMVAAGAAITAGPSAAQTTAPSAETGLEAAVARTSAFVVAMRFSDADKTERVVQLTSQYVRDLQRLLDEREATLARLGEAGAGAEVDQQVTEAWRTCRSASVALRDQYVAQLAALMTPAQVERVKDGLTRDWFHVTLQTYDEMVPGLTYPQRAHVVALLHEMRENAMLEIDPKPQEQWVGKYRGIINNYVARQGHDFAALSKAYEQKRATKNP